MSQNPHIHTLTLDSHTIHYRDPAIKHEREMAIADLLRENVLILTQSSLPAPYWLQLSASENRLTFDIASVHEPLPPLRVQISLLPFRRLIKDYFMVWESYGEAIRGGTPERLEAIDMGRRALHNEGAELLMQQLAAHASTNHDTARRLFTLICVLQIK